MISIDYYSSLTNNFGFPVTSIGTSVQYFEICTLLLFLGVFSLIIEREGKGKSELLKAFLCSLQISLTSFGSSVSMHWVLL